METLKKIRNKKGLTQAEVAAKLGITYQAYAHYETGRRQPDPEMLLKMANLFGVSTDYLLGRDETPTLTIPKTLTDTQIAFAEGLKDLDDEELQQIADFVDFLKNRKK